MSWPRPSFYATLALVLALDQLTKAWVLSAFLPGDSHPLISGLFNLTYVQNTGVAFGMFKGGGIFVALVVTAVAAGAIFFTRGLNWASWEPNLVGGALTGGAIGNLVDRGRLGFVVDFLDCHWGLYHWPVFNVADSAICLAVAWIVVRQLRTK